MDDLKAMSRLGHVSFDVLSLAGVLETWHEYAKNTFCEIGRLRVAKVAKSYLACIGLFASLSCTFGLQGSSSSTPTAL